ncbi:MAG: hypothetical protein JRN67_01915 [Nitrososphaerota archaeon]|nr:hypothetical protein [Nitrososphaerota archaeon]
MVVTTVDIPDSLLRLVDQCVSKRQVRNRREFLVNALELYAKFDALNWTPSRISIGGFRKGMIGAKFMELLQEEMKPEQLHEIGLRYGPTLHDYLLICFGKDSWDVANHPFALEHLTDMGWGLLTMRDKVILVSDPLLPSSLLRGYLEAGLGIVLEAIPTTEDVTMFRITGEMSALQQKALNVPSEHKH